MLTVIAVWLTASPILALMAGKAIRIRDTKETLK